MKYPTINFGTHESDSSKVFSSNVVYNLHFMIKSFAFGQYVYFLIHSVYNLYIKCTQYT